jgi:hypothetical protein
MMALSVIVVNGSIDNKTTARIEKPKSSKHPLGHMFAPHIISGEPRQLGSFLIHCGLVGLYEVISISPEPVPKQLARAANPIGSESFESLKLQPLSTDF